MVSAERTSRTTIRRVGLEGRPETEEPAEAIAPAAAAGGEREEVA
jgi:hypothetical protein